MKKIIEIFYDYLINPQKKQNLLHIISLLEKSQLPSEQFHILKIIAEDTEDDRIVDN